MASTRLVCAQCVVEYSVKIWSGECVISQRALNSWEFVVTHEACTIP
jgi:hypothetical protein